MQKLSKDTFPYPFGIRWTGGQVSGRFTSLQTIRWMDAKCWIITEPNSNSNFASEMASSMLESPTDFRKLDFHFNASLVAVNLAKAACKRLGIPILVPLASHSYTMLICLTNLFACLGLTRTHKLLTNFSKNSFYLLLELLRFD